MSKLQLEKVKSTIYRHCKIMKRSSVILDRKWLGGLSLNETSLIGDQKITTKYLFES